MKNIKRIVVLGAVVLGLCGLAIAQIHRSGGVRHDAHQYHGDPASAAKHLGEVFPQIASFDLNKDGKLDDAEKEALGQALAGGKLQVPAHTPPNGGQPTAEM